MEARSFVLVSRDMKDELEIKWKAEIFLLHLIYGSQGTSREHFLPLPSDFAPCLTKRT